MSICRGCGMILGQDCFNEQDCMWISQSMQQMYEQEQCLQAENQDVDALHERIKQLEQEIVSANEQLAKAAQAQQPTKLIQYRHKDGKVWFYQSIEDKLPSWACDVKPYTPPAPEGGE